MDNNENKNRRNSSMYDDDMDWLNDDDDYLEDGSLLESLLFGNRKSKNKKNQQGRDRKRGESDSISATKKNAGRASTGKNSERTTTAKNNGKSAEIRNTERPAARKSVENGNRQKRERNDSASGENLAYGRQASEESAERRSTVRSSQARYDSGRRKRATREPGASVGTTGSHIGDGDAIRTRKRERTTYSNEERPVTSSVGSVLNDVEDVDIDTSVSTERMSREAWERTQRNVAKAKAEVERLQREKEAQEKAAREQAELEVARKERAELEAARKKQEELEAEQAVTEKALPETDSVEDEIDNDSTKAYGEAGGDVADEYSDDDREADEAGDENEADGKSASENKPLPRRKGVLGRRKTLNDREIYAIRSGQSSYGDALDMDELERLEREIDAKQLNYTEQDTQDLELGEIGKALGFDAVKLEDDEADEPEGESDSEKFFREKLLDEADPKSFIKEKKRQPLSNKVWLTAFFILLALFILVCAVYIKSYTRMKYNEMDINVIDEEQLITNDGVKESTDGYRTIALYGVDSRDSSLASGVNSDSIIIVSIDESTKEIKLVSVYRDTLMEIASGDKNTHKVNYAYQVGGAVTAINTLNVNLDLNITDYVAVDFNAMSTIIDAVGGVDVDITDDEINNLNKNLAEQISLSGKYSSGITEAGSYTLDGQQAVAYSRIRSTDQGDVTRTERQRIVLMKVIAKLLQADAGSLSKFVDVSFDCISTSLEKDDIKDLVGDVSEYTIDSTVGFPFSYSAVDLGDKGSCLVAADLEENVKALHEYLYGQEHYSVSADLGKVSEEIASETGVSATTVNVEIYQPEDGIDKGDEDTGDLRTIKEAPEGMNTEE
jgi:LCP family protein required for cell wall assembly